MGVSGIISAARESCATTPGRFAKIVAGVLRMGGSKIMWITARGLVVAVLLLCVASCAGPSPTTPQTPTSSVVAPGSSAVALPASPVASPVVQGTPVQIYGATQANGGSGSGSGEAAPGLPVLFSGSGNNASQLFLVNTGTVTVWYAYDCSSAGGSGNFAASMIAGGGAAQDNQQFADAEDSSGSGGWLSQSVSPQDVGSEYYLEVSSGCGWSIIVENA